MMIDMIWLGCLAVGAVSGLIVLYGYATGQISYVVYDRKDYVESVECCDCVEKYRGLMIVGDVVGAEDLMEAIKDQAA